MTQGDGVPQTTTWEVTSQTPTVQFGAGNRPQNGFEIGFTTGQGVYGTIFVPDSSYNPATVRELIQAKADTIDAIHQLTSEG